MTRKTSLLVMTAMLVWGSRPAHAGPITFLTALPVPESQAVVRGQYFLIRATDDPTPAARELTVHGVPLVVAVGATSRLAIFGIVPIVKKSMELSTTAGRVVGRYVFRRGRWLRSSVATRRMWSACRGS